MPYCVGLTGGIGAGKSRVATLFAELGAAIVDTDEIAHELTRTGGAAMAPITAEFGHDILASDRSLDREIMRQRVFADPDQRRRLERILHPLIRQTAQARVEAASAPYVVLVVPLLLETGSYHDLVRRVLVVDCDETLQVKRAMQRSGLTAEAVRSIMATQRPRAQRVAAADDVIANDGDIADLRAQVLHLHQGYLERARGAPNAVMGQLPSP